MDRSVFQFTMRKSQDFKPGLVWFSPGDNLCSQTATIVVMIDSTTNTTSTTNTYDV